MAARGTYGFWQLAEEDPSALVVVESDGREWSAGEMLSWSRRLVRVLRASGMKAGDSVVVMLNDSALYLQIYLASLEAGFYFVPLNPASSSSEVAYVLSDSRPVVVVHQSAEEFPRSEVTDYSVEDLVKEAGALSDAEPPDRTAGAPLFYTSGTTGRPRAVEKPLSGTSPDRLGKFAAVHLNAVCGIRAKSGLVHLVVSPLYHSASLLWCTDQLHLGHRVVLAGAWDSERVLALIARYGVTGSLMVPTHFYRLLLLPESVRQRYDCSSLRHVVHTGAPCPLALKLKMLEWWGKVVYEVYGAAEGGGTRATPEEWLERPGTVGRSFGRIRILDQNGCECDCGVTGTIYIKSGPSAFSYRNDPDKTSDSQIEGHFTVGDRGYLDEDGFLFLKGRAGSMILTGGVNVYPAEVEQALLSHPQVADALVIGVPDEEYGQTVKAVVQPRSGVSGAEIEADLKLHCEKTLAPAKRPRIFHWVEHLPRNDAGKIPHQARLAYSEGRLH